MQASKSYYPTFLGMLLVVALCFIGNISMGSVAIPFDVIWKGILGGGIEKTSWRHIIIEYRVPKALTAMLVGSGLGISGLLMQTLFRNPMAGPFVLGISSGASLGVAVIILGAASFGGILGELLHSPWSLILASSLGSMSVLLTVIFLTTRIRDTMAILIIGLMFGSITAAGVSILTYFAPAAGIQQYAFWGFGSLGDLSWQQLGAFALVFFMGMVLSIIAIKPLNALLLGENYARSLGIRIQRSRMLLIIATSLLSGSVTAFAGPIVFIGLAVPHLTRLLFDSANHKILCPAVLLCGSIIMLVCDSIAQLPGSAFTLPINAITALIGAPVVIWLLIRKRKSLF